MSQLAAAQAFYTVFSLAPMLVLVVSVAGFVFGRDAARQELIAQVSQALNPEIAEFVRGVLVQTRKSLPLATAAGIVSVLFAASMAFVHLQNALNRIWGVPDTDQPILGFIKQRLFSILGVFTIGILLLLSILASTTASIASNWLGRLLSIPPFLIRSAEFVFILAVATILFAFVYRLVPDVTIPWRPIWTGAAVTAILFSAGLHFIGLYLGRSSPASAYGAAGSLFALLLWIYYSATVFFTGAEFTKVLARRMAS